MYLFSSANAAHTQKDGKVKTGVSNSSPSRGHIWMKNVSAGYSFEYIRWALRAARWKNMPFLVQNLARFDNFFCLTMIKLSNFVALKKSHGPH
jgi:hypothetical protein